MTEVNAAHPTTPSGLGWWNLYFIVKIILFVRGVIEFHPLENLSLLALLLLPIGNKIINVVRHLIALPFALWLFHYDSFLPPLERLVAQMDQLMAFEWSYLLELGMRFVPPSALLGVFLLVAGYYYLAKFFRVSVMVVLACFAVIIPMGNDSDNSSSDSPAVVEAKSNNSAPATRDDDSLNQYLNQFFSTERQRVVDFPDTTGEAAPFDILMISICSLAWDDMNIAGVSNHPFMSQFDIIFNQFNSATSYSGPALLRLTRASCGQPSHDALYQPADSQCKLFENLKALGYDEALMMNHDGVFNSLLQRTRIYGGIDAPLVSQEGLTVSQKAFAGSPVTRDLELLQRWWAGRQDSTQPVFALYNSASLHDGNRIMNSERVFGTESYVLRIRRLFDDLNQFMEQLKSSGRNVMVILIPEHGGGLRGDKMQISGMREIASPSITHIPVAVKLLGKNIERSDGIAHVEKPSGHMALSQIIANVINTGVYNGGSYSAANLSANLPETAAVSQNEGSTVIKVGNEHYISLDGQHWSIYPSN